MDLMSETNDCRKCEEPNKEITRIPRPPNAFMIFGKNYRKVLAKKFEDLSNKEISKLLGEQWKAMDRQTKNEYHKKADEAHREHLLKYPGYYYSPLEARQRKAERKHKSKMSTNYNTEDNHQNSRSFVDPVSGNRPILFRNPMYPMVRPMFGTPFHPRMAFGPRIFRFGPNYPFGGLFRPPSAIHRLISEPNSIGHIIKSDCIDGTDSSFHSFEPQVKKMMFESQLREVRADNSEPKDSVLGTDFGLISSLLPPMHNPNTEATPVQQSESHLSDYYLNSDNQVIKMTNAFVEQEFVLPHQFKEEVTEDNHSNNIASKVLEISDDN